MLARDGGEVNETISQIARLSSIFTLTYNNINPVTGSHTETHTPDTNKYYFQMQ